MLKTTYNRAFTLAEVLITLGIIGIVAAMTLPQLIQNYREKVLLQQAKKMYSVIANALVLYSNDMGTPNEYWLIFDGGKSHEDIVNGFAKYLAPIEICTKQDVLNSKCGGEYTIKQFKRANNGSGKTGNMNSLLRDKGRIVLKDGSFISIYNDNTSSGKCFFNWKQNVTDADGNNTGEVLDRTSTRCGRIYFDVNGLKGPNQYQNDVFEISVMANKFSSADSLQHTGGLDESIINDEIQRGDIYEVGTDY